MNKFIQDVSIETVHNQLFDLSVRSNKVLHKNGLTTLGKVARFLKKNNDWYKKILDTKGVGVKSMQEIVFQLSSATDKYPYWVRDFSARKTKKNDSFIRSNFELMEQGATTEPLFYDESLWGKKNEKDTLKDLVKLINLYPPEKPHPVVICIFEKFKLEVIHYAKDKGYKVTESNGRVSIK